MAVYGRVRHLDLAGAVDRLPLFSNSPGKQVAAQATGILQATGMDLVPIRDKGDPKAAGAYTALTQTPDGEGYPLMVVDGSEGGEPGNTTGLNPLKSQGLETSSNPM